MTFADKIKKLRKGKGINQEALGKVVGVTTRTVSQWENGVCYPRNRDVYQVLADYFNVDINFLLVENEDSADTTGMTGDQALIMARSILDQAKTHFAGDLLTDHDKLQFLQDIQAIFLDAHGIKKIK